ncbi:MAG: energy-coupling factor transporter transmembrane protein EcfT, partial [Tissierellales bacterium]
MLKDITLGQYFPGQSFVHLLDPRIKIIITFLFVILIFFVKTYLGYGMVFLFLVAVIAISKIPPKYVLKGLKPLLFIIILTFILNVFFTSGET